MGLMFSFIVGSFFDIPKRYAILVKVWCVAETGNFYRTEI